MTAGGWMYIGPQGIVHGTYITLLNAGRLYLGIPDDDDLRRSHLHYLRSRRNVGRPGTALEIAGGAGIIAEVDMSRIETRHSQGWISRVTDDLGEAVGWMIDARDRRQPMSVAYHGNVVDLLEFIDREGVTVDLLSDQTSCHVPYDGGYTPVGIGFDEGRLLLQSDRKGFRRLVNDSLKRHFEVLRRLTDRDIRFWDYGNAFLKAVFDAGVTAVSKNGADTNDGFIWPSYVEDIMGPMCFDYGYGPFRWVCLSGDAGDLQKTDQAAMACIDPERRARTATTGTGFETRGRTV